MYELKKEKNREINSKQTFQGVKVLQLLNSIWDHSYLELVTPIFYQLSPPITW